MQKKGRKITIGIISVVLVITGIILFYKYHPAKAVSLVFPNLDKITSVNTIIKNDSAFITINAVLQNKNPYKLTIDTLAFELFLSDTSVAKQTIPLNINQSRFDEDTVPLPLNLLMPKVMGLIRGLQNQDSTTIQIKGFIVYETIFGRKKIEFDQIKTIEVPVPPRIKVLKVERQGFNLRDRVLKATATVEIINKGKRLDLILSEVHYNMTVKNTLHTQGILKKSIIIKPESSVILKVPMEVEVFHPLKTIWKVKTDDDRLPYSLNLTFMVKENLTETSYTSPVKINATGTLELVK